MIVATVPFLIVSGFRRRLAYAVSLTATIYLIVIGVRVFTGVFFFTETLRDTIGLIAVIAFGAVVLYTVVRFYAGRVIERKLRDRRLRPDAHRSLIDSVRRSLKI